MKGKKEKSALKKLKMMEKKKVKKLLRKTQRNKSCVIVNNLPFITSEEEVEHYLKQCGQVEHIKLLRRKNGRFSGQGFVKFCSMDSAKKAIESISGTLFKGRKIEVHPVDAQSSSIDQNTIILGEQLNIKLTEDKDEVNTDVKEDGNEISERQKFDGKARRGRIIVRNIPFKITEEKFRNHFEPFGEITEVKLLKKSDGKLVGCGFVQFKTKRSAIQAILERSGKELLGRPVICDWAMPKQNYLKQVKSESKSEVKQEDTGDVIIKEEPLSDSDLDIEKSQKRVNNEMLERNDYISDGEDTDIKIEKELVGKRIKCDDENDNDNDDDEDDDDDGDDDSESGMDNRREGSFRSGAKKPRVMSHDVAEGCTVFVKNIPFSATSKELEKCMEQFGPLHYAVICIDQLTEHSKGTGFVKFKKKEDADKCLEANGELTMDDHCLEVLPALPRTEIQNLDEKKKEKEVKDSRHLYLVKEGVIVAGSHAARDVSVTDMQKRLKIEQWKTQMLRNLNMFVSNTRLVVHNVPLMWTDSDVRKLFLQHAGKGAVIKEARIMRNMRNVDASGVGTSKEFAFVHFTEQEHALRALRSINNNPDIFSTSKRPIVTFSIENKAIHKIKQQRVQKSRAALMKKNNLFNDASQKRNEHQVHNNKIPSKPKNQIQKPDNEEDVETNKYTGIIAKPGNRKLRSRFNLKTQAALHLENVKKDKRTLKVKRQMKLGRQMKLEKQKKSEIMPKARKKAVEENDSFSKLVDKYKSKLASFENQKRWYE